MANSLLLTSNMRFIFYFSDLTNRFIDPFINEQSPFAMFQLQQSESGAVALIDCNGDYINVRHGFAYFKFTTIWADGTTIEYWSVSASTVVEKQVGILVDIFNLFFIVLRLVVQNACIHSTSMYEATLATIRLAVIHDLLSSLSVSIASEYASEYVAPQSHLVRDHASKHFAVCYFHVATSSTSQCTNCNCLLCSLCIAPRRTTYSMWRWFPVLSISTSHVKCFCCFQQRRRQSAEMSRYNSLLSSSRGLLLLALLSAPQSLFTNEPSSAINELRMMICFLSNHCHDKRSTIVVNDICARVYENEPNAGWLAGNINFNDCGLYFPLMSVDSKNHMPTIIIVR